MKPYEFEAVHLSAALPLPAFQSAPGWRGAIAALQARLVKAWVGLYAAPPRRPLPPL
jgi:hypothetical protein